MADSILVTGAAGRVGAVGRTVTELLLKQRKAVRAMVRNEDDRAQALRDMGAEVVVGDLLDLHAGGFQACDRRKSYADQARTFIVAGATRTTSGRRHRP